MPLTLVLGCTPNPALEPSPGVTADQIPDEDSSSASVNPPAPRSSSEDAPPSRRTTGKDVALVDFSADKSLAKYQQAAVPVNAWPTERVLTDATPDELAQAKEEFAESIPKGHVMVVGETEACALVAGWALPHPGRVVVGWEPHPNLTCVRAVPYALFFALPRDGVNSEGSWAYGDDPSVEMLVRAGSF